MPRTKQYRIIRASWVGMLGNGFIALVKIVVGVLSNSWAVIGDGIDSAADVLSYVVTYVAARVMSRPPDHKFPYGYNRANAVATKILGFFIFFVGAQIVFSAALSLWENSATEVPSVLALWATAGSVIVKFGLTLWQYREGKRTQSKMLLANAKNMKGDIFLSLAVLIGLVFAIVWDIPQIDRYLALGVGSWIMWVAFQFWIESSRELMDGGADREVYDRVFKAAFNVPGVRNPHKARIRKLSNLLIIDLDIEVDGDLSVEEAHSLGVQVERNIRNEIDNVYDVMIHFEPLGNEEEEEFGVAPRSLN